MKQPGHPRNLVRVRDPLLRQLCAAVEASGMTDEEICHRAGYDKALKRVRQGYSCNLTTVTCLAGAIGLELRLARSGAAE